MTKNNLKLDVDTSKVQLAVYKLSKAGGLIDQGYLALAAEALSQGSWQADLKGAGSEALGKDPKAFLDDVAALQKACTGGDAAKVRGRDRNESYHQNEKKKETFPHAFIIFSLRTKPNTRLLYAVQTCFR